MELVMALCKTTVSPQGNQVQQRTKFGTAILRLQEKDGNKTQSLFNRELDEHTSWEALAAFEKEMRLTIGKVKHDGWKPHFVFYQG